MHEEALEDPGRAILGIAFMILSCGGGIGWKIYRCYRKDKQRRFTQLQLPYPNNSYANSSAIKSTLVPIPIEQCQTTTIREKNCSITSPIPRMSTLL